MPTPSAGNSGSESSSSSAEDSSGTSGTTTDTTTDESSSGSNPTAGETTETPTTSAQIRIVHAAASTQGPIDVSLAGDEVPIVANLPFASVSEFQPVTAGPYTLEIRLADADPSEPPLAHVSGEVDGDTAMTVVAIGTTPNEGTSAFRILPLLDPSDETAEGSTAIRVVQAVPDVVTELVVDLGNDGEGEFAPRGFGEVSNIETIAIPSTNTVQIGLRHALGAAITAFTVDADVLARTGMLVIPMGLATVPLRDEYALGVLLVGPNGGAFIEQNPTVYLFHIAYNAGDVDVCSNGTELVANTPYGSFSSIQLPPGVHSFDFLNDGAANCDLEFRVAIQNPEITVEAGQRYLAVSGGGLNDATSPFGLLLVPETFQPSPIGAVASAIHAAGIPTADVGLVAPGQPFVRALDQLAFGTVAPVVVSLPGLPPLDALPVGEQLPIVVIPDPNDTDPENDGIGPIVIGIDRPGALALASTARGWLVMHGTNRPGATNPFTISFVDTAPNTTLEPWTLVTAAVQ